MIVAPAPTESVPLVKAPPTVCGTVAEVPAGAFGIGVFSLISCHPTLAIPTYNQ